MDPTSNRRSSIVEWDEAEVQDWLTKLGFPQYEGQIREHRISGEVLTLLDADGLKELGIPTIGQRLSILKAVYLAKLEYNVPIGPGDYIPPSESEDIESLTLGNLHNMFKEQAARLQVVEEENRRLSETLSQCIEEIQRASQGRPGDERGLRKQLSFKWADKSQRSPTKPDMLTHVEVPQASPQQMEHDISSRGQHPYGNLPSSEKQAKAQNGNTISPSSSSAALGSSRQGSADNMKSFKVSLDDPAWKVLPAALKKYKINNDDWQNYAMFICYGTTERCLSYDEKPLLLFQKLKDAKKNPVFMLKHIKDIRSPIAVAQQKHAARKAIDAVSSPSTRNASGSGHSASRSISTRPSKLQVHNLSASNGTPPLNSAATTQAPAWPEVMSPSAEQKDKLEEAGADMSSQTRSIASTSTAVNSNVTGAEDTSESTLGLSSSHGAVASTGISYSVAIYPYMAEQEDEFDVVVGDTFIILSRARGWWVVQRDPDGSGEVEADPSKQGWVPAGCLLETNVPVATAVAEANAARASVDQPSSPASKTPILPLSILSTSFPGIALMDYRKKGDEELDLVKDDLLRVFKRYNHWSYAVKEDGGDRGWVPSWFIGKVSNSSSIPPATPSTVAPSTGGPATLEPEFRNASDVAIGVVGGPQYQISPLSSAFPPIQSRTTTV